MSSLDDWAARVLKTVEQDGAATKTIKLVTQHDGQVWNTWVAPFPAPSDWVVEVNAYLRSLEQEWPARVVAITFVAETESGEVFSQLPSKVTGKARTGALDSQTAAASVAFDNIAATIEKLQRLVNVQLDAARRTADSNAQWMHEASELIRAYRERDMMGQSAERSALVSMLEQNLPQIMTLLGHLATPGGKAAGAHTFKKAS